MAGSKPPSCPRPSVHVVVLIGGRAEGERAAVAIGKPQIKVEGEIYTRREVSFRDGTAELYALASLSDGDAHLQLLEAYIAS